MKPVPPQSLSLALAHVAAGGRLCIPTYARVTVILQVNIDRWSAAGKQLLREDGDGYRLATGKASVYLFPGQLKMVK